jgi:hypothetical protein
MITTYTRMQTQAPTRTRITAATRIHERTT